MKSGRVFFAILVLAFAQLVMETSAGMAEDPHERDRETYAREQGNRSEIEIRGREAMVSSTQPLATLAGAKILMAGGNAVDAAAAVGAALNITQPDMNQIGGDTVMLIYWAATPTSWTCR